MSDRDPWEVLKAYPQLASPDRVEPLAGAGGFSGATIWRVATPAGQFCLRRWPPEHPTLDGLQFIHSVLKHVAAGGCDFVPVPLVGIGGRSIVVRSGRLWEVAPWMPGVADYWRRPSAARLQSALTALARFHQAAATFGGHEQRGPSPAVVQRLAMLRQWRQGKADELAACLAHVDRREAAELASWGLRVLNHFHLLSSAVHHELEHLSRLHTPLQPCVRDVWHDHVLFSEDRVTGLVDFGLLQVDSVAADIARLLGSLVADDPQGWRSGLEAYQQTCRLSDEQRLFVAALDRGQVLLSCLNWLDWIFLQRRQFEDWEGVRRRLEHAVDRLQHLAGGAGLIQADTFPGPVL